MNFAIPQTIFEHFIRWKHWPPSCELLDGDKRHQLLLHDLGVAGRVAAEGPVDRALAQHSRLGRSRVDSVQRELLLKGQTKGRVEELECG